MNNIAVYIGNNIVYNIFNSISHNVQNNLFNNAFRDINTIWDCINYIIEGTIWINPGDNIKTNIFSYPNVSPETLSVIESQIKNQVYE